MGIEYLDQLCDFKEDELLALHGFEKKGLEILKIILAENGLALNAK